MKIVRIIARLNVGGPARHVVWLTEALQDEEFESILLTGRVPEGEEDMEYFAKAHGVKPIFIEEMSRELSLNDLFSLWKVYRLLLKEKPDVIHTHTAKAGTVGRTAGFLYKWFTPKTLIGKPRRVRIFHTFHGHIFHSYYGNLKTKLFLFVERCLAKFATDKIVVISEQQGKEINEEFGVGSAKQFEVIPLGIDLKPYDKSSLKRGILRKEIDVTTDEIVVGLVGRLTEVKNHELFLRAAAQYRDERKPDHPNLRFVIIGDGHLRMDLEEIAARLKLDRDVIFLGNRNDPDVFYAGLDIVALTSLNEGTPLSLIEAMANEKPVISTTVGGVVDLLGKRLKEESGISYCERGLGVETGDASGLIRGLLVLAADQKLRNGLVREGKTFVQTNYSKERLLNDIRGLYRKAK
ncbi:MAG: glycosyltransferase [Pyrinomonadaceae bacterium]|nr:glycosyltransferase [Pyrinomonadaceae bacterium]